LRASLPLQSKPDDATRDPSRSIEPHFEPQVNPCCAVHFTIVRAPFSIFLLLGIYDGERRRPNTHSSRPTAWWWRPGRVPSTNRHPIHIARASVVEMRGRLLARGCWGGITDAALDRSETAGFSDVHIETPARLVSVEDPRMLFSAAAGSAEGELIRCLMQAGSASLLHVIQGIRRTVFLCGDRHLALR